MGMLTTPPAYLILVVCKTANINCKKLELYNRVLESQRKQQMSFYCETLYTVSVSQKKLGHFYFYCNFLKCWPILIIFSLSEPEIISAVI